MNKTKFVRLLLCAVVAASVTGSRMTKNQIAGLHRRRADELAAFKEDHRNRLSRSHPNGCAIPPASSPPSCWPEKANPRSRRGLGLAATSLCCWRRRLFSTVCAQGRGKLDPKYMDSAQPPVWVGQQAWIASLCFNTVEAEKLKLPKPSSLGRPGQPAFKGHVIMPNELLGTGFLDVSAWLQCGARIGAGSSWMVCTRTSPNTPIRFQALQDGCRR